MYNEDNIPVRTRMGHYLRTGQKIGGFRPDSYKSYDLCDLCGGTVYGLDIKSIRSERNARYRALFEAYQAAKRAGKSHKIWQIAGGITTRQSHRDANAQKVGIDGAFRVGGEDLFLPNDPEASLSETANCRCSVRYVGKSISNVSEEDDIRRRTEREGEFQAEMQALRDKLDALVASVRQTPRAIAVRRRLHELDPKSHFSKAEGVIIPTSFIQRLGKIADEYYILTGEDIFVMSGTRSAFSQAEAMYNNRVGGDTFAIYKNQTAAEEIDKAYIDGVLANKTRTQIIKDMGKVITAQIAKSIFISKHLEAGATDIVSPFMSTPEHQLKFREATNKYAKVVIFEGDHWHVQF